MLIADVTRPIAEIRPCVEIAKPSLAVVAVFTPVTYPAKCFTTVAKPFAKSCFIELARFAIPLITLSILRAITLALIVTKIPPMVVKIATKLLP